MNIVRTIDKEAENFVVVNNRDNNAQSGEDFTFPRIAIVGLKIDEQQQQQKIERLFARGYQEIYSVRLHGQTSVPIPRATRFKRKGSK